MKLNINQKDYDLDVDIRTTLLDVCREHLGLTGPKKGCDHGQCGACTILVNGKRINGCLTLAVMHEGDEITTIEGIGTPDALASIQTAFIDEDAFQCGYCTSGQICSAVGMIDELKQGWPSHVSSQVYGKIELSDEEIAERMSGNLCRCAAYPNIVRAIKKIALQELEAKDLDNTDINEMSSHRKTNLPKNENTTLKETNILQQHQVKEQV